MPKVIERIRELIVPSKVSLHSSEDEEGDLRQTKNIRSHPKTCLAITAGGGDVTSFNCNATTFALHGPYKKSYLALHVRSDTARNVF